MANKKKKRPSIFESIRKPTAPSGTSFKTRKKELDRKKKHKKKESGD